MGAPGNVVNELSRVWSSRSEHRRIREDDFIRAPALAVAFLEFPRGSGCKNNNDNENDDGEDDTDYGFAILLFHRASLRYSVGYLDWFDEFFHFAMLVLLLL